MQGLQLSVNNVDQCSSIFNHNNFPYAVSLDLNFLTYTPIHTADLKIPSHQPYINRKSLVPSYKQYLLTKLFHISDSKEWSEIFAMFSPQFFKQMA